MELNYLCGMSKKSTSCCILAALFVTSAQLLFADWQKIGGPTTGSVTGVAFQNSLLFAATDMGLLKSSDLGAHWVNIASDAKQVWAMPHALLVHGFTSTGPALTKSSDDGVHWTAADSGLENVIDMVVASDDNGDTLYSAPTWDFHPNLYKSTNGGATWNKLQFTASGVGYDVLALIACGSIVEVSTFQQGLFRSMDGGRSFAIQNGGIEAVSFARCSRQWVALTPINIFISTDSGATWAPIITGLTLPEQGLLFAKGDSLLALGHQTLLISTDGGTTWSLSGGFRFSNDTAMIVSSCAAWTGKLFVAGTPTGLCVSSDAGTSWSRYAWRLATLNSLTTSRNNVLTASDVIDCGLYRSSTSGGAWTLSNASLMDDSCSLTYMVGVAALFGRDSNVYAFGKLCSMFRSSDYGRKWRTIDKTPGTGMALKGSAITSKSIFLSLGFHLVRIPYPEGQGEILKPDSALFWSGTDFVSALAAQGDSVWIGMITKGLYRSIDNGISWHHVGADTAAPVAIAFLNSNLFVGTANSVRRSTDGGQSWQIVIPASSGDSVIAITVMNGVVFVSKTDSLLYSNDAGRTWHNASAGLNALRVVQLTSDSMYLFALASDHYLWRRAIGEFATSVNENHFDPEMFALQTVFPNPVQSSATISYYAPDNMHARLAITDLLGRTVHLFQDGLIEAGLHSIIWDAHSLPNGVYNCSLSAGTTNVVRTILLSR